MIKLSAEYTFVSEKICPVCGKTLPVTQVRSRIRMVRQDTDFNMTYENINPLYYLVWFCHYCGYAAQDNFFNNISEKQVTSIKKILDKSLVSIDWSGLRSREQAIALYKVAIFYAETLELVSSRIAGLYLRLGWLYREAKDEHFELCALEKALEYYEKAVYYETFPIGNMNEITVDYLIGQLQYRTGKKELATASLNRVISNPMSKVEKRITEMARETWQEIKGKAHDTIKDDIIN